MAHASTVPYANKYNTNSYGFIRNTVDRKIMAMTTATLMAAGSRGVMARLASPTNTFPT